jgi:hypothetical protein
MVDKKKKDKKKKKGLNIQALSRNHKALEVWAACMISWT